MAFVTPDVLVGVTVLQLIGMIARAAPVEEVEGGDVLPDGGRVNTWVFPLDVTVVVILGPVSLKDFEEDDDKPDDEPVLVVVAVSFVDPLLLEVERLLIDTLPGKLASELLALPLVTDPEPDLDPLLLLERKMIPLDDELWPRVKVLNVVSPPLIDVLPGKTIEDLSTLLLKAVQ